MSLTPATPATAPHSAPVSSPTDKICNVVIDSLDPSTREALADILVIVTEQVAGFKNLNLSFSTLDAHITVTVFSSTVCLAVGDGSDTPPLTVTCPVSTFNNHLVEF